MRKFITLLYFQIYVDIIGLPVYFVQRAIVFEKRKESFFKEKQKDRRYYSLLITQNEF
jgi:hypothetical protein